MGLMTALDRSSYYKMEQMLECLLVKMRGIWEVVEASHEKIKAHQGRMMAKMEA
jgi:hypothetical protein